MASYYCKLLILMTLECMSLHDHAYYISAISVQSKMIYWCLPLSTFSQKLCKITALEQLNLSKVKKFSLFEKTMDF